MAAIPRAHGTGHNLNCTRFYAKCKIGAIGYGRTSIQIVAYDLWAVWGEIHHACPACPV